LTRDEVKAKLGKPNRIVRVATQGRLLEQWVYEGVKGAPTQYVNLVRETGSAQPTVTANYSLR
jgi:hypothetical protein